MLQHGEEEHHPMNSCKLCSGTPVQLMPKQLNGWMCNPTHFDHKWVKMIILFFAYIAGVPMASLLSFFLYRQHKYHHHTQMYVQPWRGGSRYLPKTPLPLPPPCRPWGGVEGARRGGGGVHHYTQTRTDQAETESTRKSHRYGTLRRRQLQFHLSPFWLTMAHPPRG